MTKINPQDEGFAQQIADDLIELLDEWYSLPETWDNELDTQIHKWYAGAKPVFPKRPYFSPSSANDCPRALYYKAKRAEKDNFKKPPYQGRWTAIGTAIGDVIQRDILAIERNFKKKTGHTPRFKFERTEKGEPMFEEFAKKNHLIYYRDKFFYLFGTCDGIMQYVDDSGEITRVGLEIKSKQTTSARTSHFSMRSPEESHVKQCVTYAEMYDVDYYVILYVNTSKKSWVYKDGDYEKSPDIRAFGIEVTSEDKKQVFDYFVDVLESVEKEEPMPLSVDKWLFNPYKTVIAKDLTDEEVRDLKKQRDRAMNSTLPEFKKRDYVEVVDFVEAVRDGA